jgi:acetyl-CoA carboxylase biotin carboxyl carrier protein
VAAADPPDDLDVEPILAAVDAIAPTFAAGDLEELEVEVGDIRVRLVRPGAVPAPAPPLAAVAAAAPTAATGPEPAPGHRFVTAPLTGIWYTAPSPGARPYVTVGAEVAAGQVVGLIEAMKLFNEIKSDAGGTVTRLVAESGKLVKRQQPLIEIDPA